MSGRLSFDGTVTTTELLEAALAAGAALQPPWLKVVVAVNCLIQFAGLASLGAALLHAFGPPASVGAHYAGLAGAILLAYLVVFGATQLLYRTIYATVSSGPFARGLRFVAGPDGVAIQNGRSTWLTDWRDVTHVRETKRTIVAVASGVALPVAKRAVDDPDAALARMRAWWEAAR